MSKYVTRTWYNKSEIKMDTIADDLLEGIKAISRFTGTPERRTFYLAEKGQLDGVFKQGGRWIGLKSKIRDGYIRKASGTTEAA
jgi:hypothetical protein